MKINGEEYTAPELNFTTMRKMENFGVTLNTIDDKPLNFLGAYVAIAIGSDLKAADEKIDAHINAGGTIDELSKDMKEAIEKSGFFKKPLDSETQPSD
jgi:sporulation-control protein spo0M